MASWDIQMTLSYNGLLLVEKFAHYSLQQTQEINDILRVDFVPVGIEGVCGQTGSQIQMDMFQITFVNY